METFLPTAVCLLTLSCVAVAQDRPESPADRALIPRQTATLPAAATDHSKLEHSDWGVLDVLSLYTSLAGTKVLIDNTVQGNVSLPKLDGLGNDLKVELIEKAIFLNGFCLYDAGDGVVAVLGLGKVPRCEGLPVYTKPEEFPVRERVFSYAIKLEHRSPLYVAGMLQQYIPPMNVTAFTPDGDSRTLIITGRTTSVRRLLKLIPLLDVPVVAAAAEKPPQPVSKPSPASAGAGGQ